MKDTWSKEQKKIKINDQKLRSKAHGITTSFKSNMVIKVKR